MSTPYVGEIRIFGFGRVPVGWLACDGSAVPISQYEVLFTVLGDVYGGNGSSTFGLPDLRGRAPIHQGTGVGLTQRIIGERGGSEDVTVLTSQMPAHNHILQASSRQATTSVPGSSYVTATVEGDNLYLPSVTGLDPNVLDPGSLSIEGGGAPHDNMMPSLTVSYCIAWNGIFPSQG